MGKNELRQILETFKTLSLEEMKNCVHVMDQFLKAKTNKDRIFWMIELELYLPLNLFLLSVPPTDRSFIQNMVFLKERSYREDQAKQKERIFTPIVNVVLKLDPECKKVLEQRQKKEHLGSQRQERQE